MDDVLLLKSAVLPLLGWYRIHKRTLPWREKRDFYRVWLSEIMLQQTRVEAVKEYYLRFLERFPTVEALASAELDEVLKLWEGLGYYSRARHLHEAARLLAGGPLPTTYEEVCRLPGIGPYTAGAISSIAFNEPRPAVDGNVLRILTRLLADEANIDFNSAKEHFAALLREVYPPEAGEFCEALMELGALVCIPSGAPMCGACPWQSLCRAHLKGREEDFPVRAKKAERRKEELFVYVLFYEGKFALERRPDKGLLAGLWQFPVREREESFGPIRKEKKAKHVFSHVEWHMTGRYVEPLKKPEGFTWVSAEELKAYYPLPSAFKAFLPWLKEGFFTEA